MVSVRALCPIALNLFIPNLSIVLAILSAVICGSRFGCSTSAISICGFSRLNFFLSVFVSFLMFSPFLPTTRPGLLA